MPIVAPDCPCDTEADVCCDSFFLKADRIRTVAWNAVRECTEDGCCADRQMRTFVTLDGDMPDPFGDSVMVAWLGTTPVVQTAGGHTPSITPHRSEYRVQISASGWPVLGVESGRILMPTADTFQQATRHVVGHAEKAYRAVVNAVQHHTLFTNTPGLIFKGIRVSDVRPLPPAAYIARAAFLVSVDVAL